MILETCGCCSAIAISSAAVAGADDIDRPTLICLGAGRRARYSTGTLPVQYSSIPVTRGLLPHRRPLPVQRVCCARFQDFADRLRAGAGRRSGCGREAVPGLKSSECRVSFGCCTGRQDRGARRSTAIKIEWRTSTCPALGAHADRCSLSSLRSCAEHRQSNQLPQPPRVMLRCCELIMLVNLVGRCGSEDHAVKILVVQSHICR